MGSIVKDDVTKYRTEREEQQEPAHKAQKGNQNQAVRKSFQKAEQPQVVGGKSLMKVTKKYQHLLHLGCVGEEELVVVEDKPQSMEARLPPSMRQKKFGAM